MTDRVYNVLFLCTGNSARSILAECLLNREGKGQFKAFCAGSFPKGEVHPMAIETLTSLGFDTTGARSKSWDEFAVDAAPEMDFIFTVCDDAAGETCPIWPGHPMTAHWGVPDPAAVEGARQERAFDDAFFCLKQRISLFISLPLDSIESLTLKRRLDEIGTEGCVASPALS